MTICCQSQRLRMLTVQVLNTLYPTPTKISELLQDCIAFTGDVDTVGAISPTGYAYALAPTQFHQ